MIPHLIHDTQCSVLPRDPRGFGGNRQSMQAARSAENDLRGVWVRAGLSFIRYKCILLSRQMLELFFMFRNVISLSGYSQRSPRSVILLKLRVGHN
jgi:hypothetical protein